MDVAKYCTQAQKINWRHGLFRIWIVFSVIWCGVLSVAGVASYIEDISRAHKPSAGLFDDLIPTNSTASSFQPSAETVENFLIPLFFPLLIFFGFKAMSMLWTWIYGGFKAEETARVDYVGVCRKVASTAGRWSFKVFLYVFASAMIAALLAVITTKIYQWLDISLDGNYALTNPFVLLGVLLQFAAFKWIFFKEGEKGTAFLAYVTVTIFLFVLMFGVIALIAYQPSADPWAAFPDAPVAAPDT